MSFDIKAMPFTTAGDRKYTITIYQTVKTKQGTDAEIPDSIENLSLADLEQRLKQCGDKYEEIDKIIQAIKEIEKVV